MKFKLLFLFLVFLLVSCGGKNEEESKPKTKEDFARDTITNIMKQRFGEFYSTGYKSLNFGKLTPITGHIDTALVWERIITIAYLKENKYRTSAPPPAPIIEEEAMLMDSLNTLRAFNGYTMSHTYLDASDTAMIEVIYDEQLNIRGIIVK